MTSQLSLIYTTFLNEEEAVKVARVLLEKHLIACVNILGTVRSLYKWEEKVEDEHEVGVLLKTTSEKVEDLINVLESLHSYKTPAILEIPVEKCAASFGKWVSQQIR